MPLSRRLAPVLHLLVPLCILAGCTGQYAHQQGRYDVNIAEYEAALAKGNSLDRQDYYLLCDAYSNTKNYAKVFDCADQFVKTTQQADLLQELWTNPFANSMGEGWQNPASLADFWRAQAQVEMGRYAEAIATADRAVARLQSPATAGSLSGQLSYRLYALKGLAQAFQKDAAGARQTIRDIEKAPCGFVGGITCGEERSQALTKVYVALGRYEDAAKILDQATIIKAWGTIVVGGNLDMYMVPRRFLQSKIHYEAGKTAEAKQGYLELYNAPATRANGTVWWNVLYDLGRIARSEGDGALAVERLAGAVETIEAQRSNINTEAAKIGFVGDKQAVYSELVSLLVAQGRAGEAFEYVERAKSRALVDLLAERQNLAGAGGQADAGVALKQLASLEQKYVASGTGGDEQKRLRSAMTSLKDQMAQKAPELASLVTVSTVKAADIQRLLSTDETLVEYYGSGDDLYAFTVARGSVTATKLDGRGLERDVRALREALRAYNKDTYKPIAQALYNRLIAPLPGALDRPGLVIVGHGALHYLPFNALYDGQKFLVDTVAIELLPSASVMQFLAARHPATARDMLLLGNPDLGDKAYDLPGAEAEARAIKGIWPNSTMLMRKAATKSALTKAGQLFRVIHVAAHGEFASDQPLASRLLLAPEGSDNGQLTAGDLYGLRLNADLVTLSACETGMGKVLSGDDVVGLTRGFLYAGANSIVASLWPVSDDETKFLMTSFYGNLKRMPKADALRQAQLETKKKYPHPFFWSAFQLTGLGR